MPQLFSRAWCEALQEAWNNDAQLAEQLGKAGFSSMITYGLLDEDKPAAWLQVKDGLVVSVDAQPIMPDWDLRATSEQWGQWSAKPPGLMELGMAYSSRRLKFERGDYATMLKNPALASSFVRSFTLFQRIT